jgi:hypothetical protein
MQAANGTIWLRRAAAIEFKYLEEFSGGERRDFPGKIIGLYFAAEKY